jgi:hypothetical protein
LSKSSGSEAIDFSSLIGGERLDINNRVLAAARSGFVKIFFMDV